MKLFGYEVVVRKQTTAATSTIWAGSSLSNWLGPIREGYSGAWQQNVTVDPQQTLLSSSTLWTCVNGIASDIAKLRLKLSQDNAGIWKEIPTAHGNAEDALILNLLRKPNHYQNRIQFVEAWILSKLLAGNTYVLKERDERGNVRRLYVLSPMRCVPLVAEDGSVYYRLNPDYLSQVDDSIVVPATEIIHDRMTPLWHPLVGVSPLYAAGISATMAGRIKGNSTNFFNNSQRPGGLLSAPGHISDDTAARLKTYWETNFGGANAGKTAILGDGLTFEALALTAENSQLIEQLQFTNEDIARPFHYPQWKLGGPVPPYSNGPDAINTAYYTDCLQPYITSLEECLDLGLELAEGKHIELDLDELFRMDTKALYEANNLMVTGGWAKPNEARFRANYAPVEGGDTPYLQQQNYSLAALAKRDAKEDPFATAKTPAPAPPPEEPEPEDQAKFLAEDDERLIYEAEIRRGLIPA